MVLPHPLPDDLVELIARRFRVIGEPMRIRLLDRLRDGEATVGQLSEALSASQQNISKHLAVLADVGILGRRKEGNHVYYRVVDEGVFALCEAVGPLGKLGRWTADHVRAVALAWAVLALALGLFAPKVESALSGAGWQANGSESVQARTLIQANFAGLSSSALMVVVHSQQLTSGDNGFRQTVSRIERILRANAHVGAVVAPR